MGSDNVMMKHAQRMQTNVGHNDETQSAYNREAIVGDKTTTPSSASMACPKADEHLLAASGNSVAPVAVSLPTSSICLEARAIWSDEIFDRSALSRLIKDLACFVVEQSLSNSYATVSLGLRITLEPPEEWSSSVEIDPSDVVAFAGLALTELEECKFMARLTALVCRACRALFPDGAVSSRSRLHQLAVKLCCRELRPDETRTTEPGYLVAVQNAQPLEVRSEHSICAAEDTGFAGAAVARTGGCWVSNSAPLPPTVSMRGPPVEPNLGVRFATAKCSQADMRIAKWRRWKSGVLRPGTLTRTTKTRESADAQWKSTGSNASGAVETLIESETSADVLAEDPVIAEAVRALFTHRDDGPGAMKRMRALLTACRDPSYFRRCIAALQMFIDRREFDVCLFLLNSLRRTAARASKEGGVNDSEAVGLSRQFNATLDRFAETIAAATGGNPCISACSNVAATHMCGI